MAKIVYGKRDTKTVVSIDKAPQSIQRLWNQANSLGVNMLELGLTKNDMKLLKEILSLDIMLVKYQCIIKRLNQVDLYTL